MKRIVSVLVAVLLLSSCFLSLPVLADGTETSGEPVEVANIDFAKKYQDLNLTQPTDANGLEQTENALLVLEAMKTLSETEQMIVSLYLYSGLKQTEIAKVLNIPYLSVRSKYGYAIRKLKRYFERKGVHTDET